MEDRIQQAIKYLQENPGASLAKAVREFAVPRGRLRYRAEGRPPRKGIRAANTRLTVAEEAAVCRYIDRLDHINLAVRAEFITDAANAILRERSRDPEAHVGCRWTTRFIKRHHYSKRLQKTLNSNRAASEDLNTVKEYFEKLQQVIHEQGIVANDIWNMDETGFRIGVGKNQLIITKRKRAHYFSLPENSESATAVEAISTAGEACPAFLILSGQMVMSQFVL